MTMRDRQKLDVQQQTDIIRLIGEQVALRPRGKEYIGLCPFHDDKNPSMYVSPVKQIYKCFSCNAGGDVFSFVMNYHKMSFPEALEHLAQRAGIKLVREGPGRRAQGAAEDDGPTDRQRIMDANAKATSFYRALLRHAEHGRIARDYVAQRKISPEMVEAFQIGVAPDRWDGLAMMIAEKNWDAKAFEMAGLISARQSRVQSPESRVQSQDKRDDSDSERSSSDSGLGTLDSRLSAKSYYDRLRHRLIFPIFDALGRPIAFGGREMPGAVLTAPRDGEASSGPKYLNSPETVVFNKSGTLYGLHLAKQPIIASKTAVIVEGYTDVIACHQAGVKNAVATLGTALTIQHVHALRHLADKVVLIYDGDEAGLRAADRAVEVFFAGSLDVYIAVIADELDPADVFELPDGMARWKATMDGAVDALEFQFRRVGQSFKTQTTLAGRQRVTEEYLGRLAQAGLQNAGPLRRGLVLQRLSELLKMQPTEIQEMIKRLAPVKRLPVPMGGAGASGGAEGGAEAAGVPSGRSAEGLGAINEGADVQSDADNVSNGVADAQIGARIKALAQAEREVMGCLLRDPGLFNRALPDGRALDEALTPADFVTTAGRRLYERLYEILGQSAGSGGGLTLASLVGELAAAGEQDLVNLATRAEADAELGSEGNAEKLNYMMQTAVACLLAVQSDRVYRQARQGVSSSPPAGAADHSPDASPAPAPAPGSPVLGDDAHAERVRRLMQERLKTNPAPGRIARLKM